MQTHIDFNNININNRIINHIRLCIAETLRIPKAISNCTGIDFKASQKILEQIYFHKFTINHEKLRYAILCVIANNRYYDPGNVWPCTRAAIEVLLPWFLMTLSKEHYKKAKLIPCRLNNLLPLLTL